MSRSPIRLVALVSSYREGRLVRSAIESVAPHVDRVLVMEGPFGDAPVHGEESDLDGLPPNVEVRRAGPWRDDAHKRTGHIQWACANPDKRPLWAVILDGDEILMHGEQLRITVERARPEDRLISLRFTNWDGTVERTFHRIARVDLIRQYLLGAHRFTWKDSDEIQVFPNFLEICPDPALADELEASRSMLRPPYRWPLQGEPHIFHRPFLRPDRRFDERASDAEAEWAKAEAARLTAG